MTPDPLSKNRVNKFDLQIKLCAMKTKMASVTQQQFIQAPRRVPGLHARWKRRPASPRRESPVHSASGHRNRDSEPDAHAQHHVLGEDLGEAVRALEGVVQLGTLVAPGYG